MRAATATTTTIPIPCVHVNPDGSGSRVSSRTNLSTTFEQESKRTKLFAAAEKRRIYNLIIKAIKDNEALNNVLRQRESNKKIPMINESDNFNASAREVLQNLAGNYRYIGTDGFDTETRYGFRGFDWDINRVILRSDSGGVYRVNFQYFLENFSKMNNNFGRRRKRKRKKVKRKRKKVKRKSKKVKRKRKKTKRKRKVKKKVKRKK